MRVRFRQSGGLAFTAPRVWECDLDAMAEAEARELRALVRAAGLVGSEQRLAPQARDAERYELTVCEGADERRLVCDSASVGPELEPLLAFLRERARPERGAAAGRRGRKAR